MAKRETIAELKRKLRSQQDGNDVLEGQLEYVRKLSAQRLARIDALVAHIAAKEREGRASWELLKGLAPHVVSMITEARNANIESEKTRRACQETQEGPTWAAVHSTATTSSTGTALTLGDKKA